jgi:hypothetical protein
MGRKRKEPFISVMPVSSKKQLLRIEGVCNFLGGISADVLADLRGKEGEGFPAPIQMLGSTPMWTVEQIERYVSRKEKEVESLSA